MPTRRGSLPVGGVDEADGHEADARPAGCSCRARGRPGCSRPGWSRSRRRSRSARSGSEPSMPTTTPRPRPSGVPGWAARTSPRNITPKPISEVPVPEVGRATWGCRRRRPRQVVRDVSDAGDHEHRRTARSGAPSRRTSGGLGLLPGGGAAGLGHDGAPRGLRRGRVRLRASASVVGGPSTPGRSTVGDTATADGPGGERRSPEHATLRTTRVVAPGRAAPRSAAPASAASRSLGLARRRPRSRSSRRAPCW